MGVKRVSQIQIRRNHGIPHRFFEVRVRCPVLPKHLSLVYTSRREAGHHTFVERHFENMSWVSGVAGRCFLIPGHVLPPIQSVSFGPVGPALRERSSFIKAHIFRFTTHI